MPVPRRFDRRPPDRDPTRINDRIRVPKVRLIGAGFQPGISVSFGSAPATSVVVVDARTIDCLTPPQPAGAWVDVALTWPEGDGPSMILDDGGDATLLVHKGAEFENAGAVPDPDSADSEEFQVVLRLLQRTLSEDPQKWTRIGEQTAATRSLTKLLLIWIP